MIKVGHSGLTNALKAAASVIDEIPRSIDISSPV